MKTFLMFTSRNICIYMEDEKYKIANTIIKMANELKISVIAEGVETQHEFKALESAKCSKYQGYYFSKPLTSNEFEKIL